MCFKEMSEENEISFTNKLVFFVNGKKVEDSNVDPEWTLLYYLRRKLRLCGSKLGCGEGGCGACTVMVSKYDRKKKDEIHIPVNSCLAPVCAMHGLSVTTIEGIGSTRSKLHPVQERIAKAHGTQCGFCIPGFVMSMYTVLRQHFKPKLSHIEEAFQGNLCRCTGYRSIMEGYKTFTKEWMEDCRNLCRENDGECRMGENCCKEDNEEMDDLVDDGRLFRPEKFTPYDSSQEPIFPPELKLMDIYDKQYLKFQGSRVTWYRPTTIEELLDLKHKYPESKIVVGNTEIGLETKQKNMIYPILIQPSQIDALTTISENAEGVRIGAAVTLEDIRQYVGSLIIYHCEESTRILKAFNKMLIQFGGPQTRSVSSLGGNIMTGSPISDLVIILMASGATLEVQSKKAGTRILPVDGTFYIGYRKTVLEPQDILVTIMLPFSNKYQYFEVNKQSRRRYDDIAIVNMAVSVIFEEDSYIIDDICFGIGGMSFKTVDAPNTRQGLKGLPWTKDTVNLAYSLLLEDLPLDPCAPGGMIRYRQTLVLGLFLKAFLAISETLQIGSTTQIIESRDLSGAREFESLPYESSQYFSVVPGSRTKEDSLKRPMVNVSAYRLACGEAVYVDDMPFIENELYMALVLSKKAHAKIVKIDANDAMKMEGVVGVLTDKDVNVKQNSIGFLFEDDEKLFNSKKVTSIGQMIAVVVAEDQLTAQRAVKSIEVSYEDIHPIIITIEDAIKNKSFHKANMDFNFADGNRSMEKATHRINGTCKTGNQKNFYMETQSVLCVPKEDGGMDIYSATQCPMNLGNSVSKLLGVPINRISVITKRLGGAFGGKQWKSILLALPAALAAKKFQRPVRCMISREEDMLICGGRSPYLFEYYVGFDDRGKILGCDFNVFVNGGNSIDNTTISLRKTLTHLDNAFRMPNVKARGKICKTNIPSNGAMRGFGAPEATFASLCIIDDIAEHLEKDFIDIVKANIYKAGDLTYFKQEIDGNLNRCFEECLKISEYTELKAAAEKFNSDNRYKKRGVAITPAKYGVGVDASVPFFSQAAALVNVYTDGSVLLHHGGIEMGQGLHTKMIQIVTRVFEIPAHKIYTDYTATNIIPNGTRTAASLGSDLLGPAVIDACNQIKERLSPLKEANPAVTWEDLISQAYLNKISLSATGFYRTEDTGEYDPETKTGRMFNYFVSGAGCSEVEIDTLTGDHQLISTVLVMDLGESMNPAIDIGQIEGAFIQGYGFYVMEESVFSPDGKLYTTGPSTYKIPGFSDIPRRFHVSLLKGSSNPRAVYSSKAVGEPPLGLAASVFFAIKDAIKSARKENGVSTAFRMDAPATAERIRIACIDDILEKVPEPVDKPSTSWSVVS